MAFGRVWQELTGVDRIRRLNVSSISCVGAVPDFFTLKQIADRLQLSERTLYRLLSRGELPGRKIGGQWRFRPSELDYWLDVRLGRMRTVDHCRVEGDATEPALSLSEALRPANALILIPPGTRREVIAAFAAAVTDSQGADGRALAAPTLEPEELSSTAIGHGVAVLHTARWQSRTLVESPLVALGRLLSPVDFGAIDGSPTDLLLLVLAPNPRMHLTLLARAARICRDPGLLLGLRAARNGREVIRLIRASERRVLPPAP
jgi:PTS system nitrogen regulatory IIA component